MNICAHLNKYTAATNCSLNCLFLQKDALILSRILHFIFQIPDSSARLAAAEQSNFAQQREKFAFFQSLYFLLFIIVHEIDPL